MEVHESAHDWHAEAAHDGSETPVRARRRQRIIHVEDDADLRFICSEILGDAGFDVLGCATLEAARIALQTFTPDVLLLDRDLPDGSGLDLARWVRSDASYASVLIVALTGRRAKCDVETAIVAGCDAFIGKPCAPHLLVETIEALMRPVPDIGQDESGVRRMVAAAL